ncbi:MAG: glycoside hydrolase family 97 protein [Saprospiraceae bacterium]|nr:glycoside hydrolase family 97 protein [Saprospiraceae bacterium]
MQKNRSSTLSIVIFSLLLFSYSCTSDEVRFKSPSANLEARIYQHKKGLLLELTRSSKVLVQAELGKFIFGQDTLGLAYDIEESRTGTKDEQWVPVHGEKSTIRDNYRELSLNLRDNASSPSSIQLVCRLYDEGVAFRYHFDSTITAPLDKELTSFHFAQDHQVWVTERSQGPYQKMPISSMESVAERPLVMQQSDSSYLAIGEAALVDFARMKLIAHPQEEAALQVELEGAVDLSQAKHQSPWRYIMVANSPGKLLENNYFILNLNERNQIGETSWIKPGKVIREVTLTTQGGLACIDFAVKHNLQYVEFDAGWYGNEYDDASDATSVTVDPKRSPGPLDLPYIIDYANKKGIGILLYVNRRALEQQLDEVLPLYKSWGIKGVKYGFVRTGPQEWTAWLHEAIRKAADHQLMVDVHDDYRPTGYSRTYPNLMTQEGIRGDEESPSTEHTLITAFTRMIAGAGDNTNCYLASRVSDKMGGRTAQMAKAILLYSPWQFLYWYDRPEASPHKKGGAGAAQGIIQADENLDFYDQLPVIWEDTRVLEGRIGEYATIARKSQGAWFIGALTANTSREVHISLDFLEEDKSYEATIYFQDEADLEKNQIQSEKIMVQRETIFSRKLPADGGLALIIRRE